ncbi:HNH endonuclease with NUMOD4 motif and intron encoded nuclease repeat [Fadolivirus algeromassiliense]|jgi:hypothetical protein|uniref:HNH endonuclease with NUMOD4 motif and intron encoded nuclease repeat n=1 Tax=Fadolivirus FV1/VV64 TaxID=3070911 RepID=A0A7D3QWB3_9VIRU|nr:HNH endonuclease with NUMOD4 motif and intron encoded nuclease repeat [Fadolivirus algeromassiliense]QKF94359.1 HNH endonuclease with NUMOD4 motif and intron encoded nuclease repeat [Fadolivirus FV1/VV64]
MQILNNIKRKFYIVNIYMQENRENEIEQWKEIEGFGGKYMISNFGNVKSKFIKRYIRISNKNKYNIVNLKDDRNKIKKIKIHVIVAKYFIENDDPINKTTIIHIDGNLKNNKWNNLEWNKFRDIQINDNIDWKDVNGYEQYYCISDIGKIINKNTNQILSTYISGRGYPAVSLTKNGKKKNIYVHKLVAEHFVPNSNPKENTIVDHIDNNKLNYHYINLRWVTPQQNSKLYYDNFKQKRKIIQFDLNNNFVKEWNNIGEIIKCHSNYNRSYILQCCTGLCQSAYKYLWKYEKENEIKTISDNIKLEQDEVFKNLGIVDKYDFSNYEVSNYGKIRNIKINKYLTPIKRIYYELCIRNKITSKRINVSIHRLVAFAFVSGRTNKRNCVNHKDSNKFNNYYKNLEWVTIKENTVHACGKSVVQIDITTNKMIRKFPTIKEAERFLKLIHTSSIVKCCKGNQKYAYGYKWQYLYDYNNYLIETYVHLITYHNINNIKILNSFNALY